MIRTNPEKGIGVDPGWQAISWDEAMDILASRIHAAREKDPRSIVGLSFDRFTQFMLRAFATAIGSPNVTAGSATFFCGNGMHPVAFTLTGSNDVHPDLDYCNHLVMFGTSYGFVAQMNAMGITSQMAAARARGMKLTVVDPVLSYAASHADEWIPIRPGTDAALALALMREWVIELDDYDKDFLRRYTNAPYLVGMDGRYARDPVSGKPLVGISSSGQVQPFDTAPPHDVALDGEFIAGGQSTKPSFVEFKDNLRKYTPEHAAAITSVPQETIRRLAREVLEAAQIGQTVMLDGEAYPLRPATFAWYRGVSAHRHSMHNGMALGQLNVLLGAVDVPGGLLNASGSGPGWMPTADPDGVMTPGNRYIENMKGPLPRRSVTAPETLGLVELFPVSVYAHAMLWLGILQAEELGLPYRPEVLIQSRCNIMMTSGDPDVMAEALKAIPFVCSLNTFYDETSQFADLLLPDAHALERLVPLVYNPYYHYTSAAMPFEHYTWNFQQPVVKAVPQAKSSGEVLLELAERLDILSDMYGAINASQHLEGDHRLQRDRSYSWEEIADRLTRSVCGDDHGLDYFYRHGFYRSDQVRDAKASYPRRWSVARIALYLEHFIDAGLQVKAWAESRTLTWDTTDYTPVVDWKPCLTSDQAPPEYDLWVVNQKLPFMTFSFTAENPLLVDLAERNSKVFNVGINSATAARKGIRDGDRLVIETPDGKRAEGLARTTEGVHPECLAVPGVLGRWGVGDKRVRGQGVHFNSLLSYSLDRMDTVAAALDACVKVRIMRAA
jgi:anaerobic selenocysteine-containing dehydrogenase